MKSGIPLCKLKYLIREKRCLWHPWLACGAWLRALQPHSRFPNTDLSCMPWILLMSIVATCEEVGRWSVATQTKTRLGRGKNLLWAKLVGAQIVSGEQLDGFSFDLLSNQGLWRAAASIRQHHTGQLQGTCWSKPWRKQDQASPPITCTSSVELW